MKTVLIAILITISFGLSAQIDTSKISVTSDSTFQEEVAQDTMYWKFDSASKRVNGKTYLFHRAKLVRRVNGVEIPQLDSGVLRTKEYREWLNSQKTWILNDIEHQKKALSQLQDFKAAIQDELKE